MGKRCAVVLGTLLLAARAAAADADSVAGDPALEARVHRIASELRCLVCQNETLAESGADLARDLRAQVRRLLAEGRSDADVLSYMAGRYGDFVLYRPPVKHSTLVLWLAPAALLALGSAALIIVLRRRSRLGDEHFEPDPADDEERVS